MRFKVLPFLAISIIAAFSFGNEARSQDAYAAANQPLYAPTKPEYLLKSSFLLGAYDITKDTDIDQYLMITECSLYEQFFQDDLEWSRIREATRSYIKTNKEAFSRRFEFVQPTMLGRYDEARGGFEILPSYQILGVKKMQVSQNFERDIKCLEDPNYSEKDFPINAILNLSRPLDYTFIRVNKAQADEYLQYLKDNKIEIRDGRPAYMRFRFKVEQNMGSVQVGLNMYSDLYGALEAVAVFGDREMFIKFEEKKF